MARYISRFILDYAKITAPLRNLTKQGVDRKWTAEEQTALDSLKEALVGDTIPKPSKLLKMTAFPSGPWKEVSIDFA
jgi:hypothetical protein